MLASIAENYAQGTPNGIRMDADSALIWSPAISPGWTRIIPPARRAKVIRSKSRRCGFACCASSKKSAAATEQKKWRDLAERATASLEKLFWLEDKGWFADVLLAEPGVTAREATPDDALRSNCLFAVSLGLVTGERAKRCVEAAQKYLVVPGALALARAAAGCPCRCRFTATTAGC